MRTLPLAPIPSRTTWTLARDGRRLTCTLLGTSGRYVLQLTLDGQRILDEPCESPQHAMTRSVDAFGALLRRGWLCDTSQN